MTVTQTTHQRFTADHLRHWREHGYVVVEGWLSADELAAALTGLDHVAPGWAVPPYDAAAYGDRGFVEFSFPYCVEALDDVTLHPALLAFACQALRYEDVVLAHSELMIKRAAGHDSGGYGFDQPLHTDHEGNTLVVPDLDNLDQLATITYYTDVTLDLGPTFIVDRQHSVGWHDRNFLPRDAAPGLYEYESPVTVPAGSIVLYTMGTFHRGSGFRAATGVRASHHVAYQRADVTWGGVRSYAGRGSQPDFVALLSRLTSQQRSAIGFPAPGHAYWTPSTLAAVAARYPAMDVSPYAVSERS
jgi:hypothetical protein